jgi:sugar fermentation stimulation protein A
VRFDSQLTEGRLVRRYKRFLADIELADGEVVVSHCPNPGSMKTCAPDRARVWISKSDNPKRKLAYTWELVESAGAMVCVNTARANDIVAEAIDAGAISELTGYDTLRREVKYGENSRVDIVLERESERCFVEVKSVTLSFGDRVSAFPDSVTKRGTKHLEELIRVVEAGDRAVMLFCCNRDDTSVVRPADEIDPVYGDTLRKAKAAGVELIAYRCDVSPTGIEVRERVPIEL